MYYIIIIILSTLINSTAFASTTCNQPKPTALEKQVSELAQSFMKIEYNNVLYIMIKARIFSGPYHLSKD